MNDELLKLLIAEKTPEELDRLKKKLAISKLSGILHTLLCPCDHEKDCDFYKEEVCTEPSRDQETWRRRTALILAKAGLHGTEVEEILQIFPPFISFYLQKPAFLRFLAVILPTLIEFQAAQLEGPSSSQSGPSNSAGFPAG